MSTLETQYREFLRNNPGGFCSFEEWKKINARLIKQALVNMMKKDEELGLYDEPFRHKVETIPIEEILANRSSAYDFIDFDKQELEILEVPMPIYKQEQMYSEEEVINIAKQAFVLGKDFGLIGTFKEWFDTVKKKS
jgi:hypothetical protein